MIKAIKDIWYAISSPEKYRDFMDYKRKTIAFYVLVLTLITSCINFGIPAAQFMSAGGFEKMFNLVWSNIYRRRTQSALTVAITSLERPVLVAVMVTASAAGSGFLPYIQ